MEESKVPEEVTIEKEKKVAEKKTTAKKPATKKATTKSTTTKKATTTTKSGAKKTTKTATKPKTTVAKTAAKKTTKKTTEATEPKKEVKKTEKKATVKEVVQEEKVEKKEEPKVVEEVKSEKEPQPKWEKVEEKKESKASNKKPKKKHRFIKTILILIALLLALFLIHFYRNYMIILNLVEKQAETVGDKNNYSYVSEHYTSYDTNDKTVIERYYKDGKTILVRNSETPGILWFDNATKEFIVISPTVLKATVTTTNELLGLGIPSLQGEDNYALKLAFMFLISSEEVDGKDCYKIEGLGSTNWIDKETGLILKTINGKRVINGEQYDDITEWKNYRINKLTEQDVSRPNLLGYDVTIQD